MTNRVSKSTPKSSSEERCPNDRQIFSAEELAIVLSRFDLGAIQSIQEFARGSRRAPKVVLRCDQGTFLLKRRARGKDNPCRVAFSHELQLALASKRFPLPHLVGTKKDNNSMLQHGGAIYELFEYINGTSYNHSNAASAHAGKILAWFHRVLLDYEPMYEPSHGSYHAAPSVIKSLQAIPRTMGKLDACTAGERRSVNQIIRSLHATYKNAANNVDALGFLAWPTQIVHCDWHPGNMLFHESRVTTVMDFDAARIEQRIIDVANGALQFSMLTGGEDTSTWPDGMDGSRYRCFVRAYDQVGGCVLTRAEIRALPWLMIEALIAEAVIPIATTGSFAQMNGFGFLKMIERKVHWLQKHQQLTQVLEEAEEQ